jgi:HK97 family phage major capsid protein
MKTARELRQERAELIKKLGELVGKAETENRAFSDDEQTQYDEILAQADELEKRAQRLEQVEGLSGGLQGILGQRQAPAHNRGELGDNENHALAAFVRRGDMGGVTELRTVEDGTMGLQLSIPSRYQMAEQRVNDTIINITTAADGGDLVPTGFVNKVAARLGEVRLAERLGVQRIPGSGTTVNHPYENADPVAFTDTAEQDDAHAQTYTRDAPVFGLKAFTLAKETKKLELTEEELQDEDANLMGFIADWIGRAMGITHNAKLFTEVAANGSTLKTWASATAIADGEPEDVIYGDTIGYYLDDGGSIAWAMRPSTYGNIKSISGNARKYGDFSEGRRTLLEYPVFYSNQVAATAASAKDLYFGNWYNVGMREAPALTLLRDPYTVDGIVILKYSFRLVYGVLVAGAVGYGVHPSA